ncbi:MAG: hypothetical protein HOD85_14625 [Deltaproteobacteria bacterium]|nr:hypothetical protein [Deltaproteobacteria bacterium]
MVKPKTSFSKKKKRPEQTAINKLLESNVGEEDIAATEVDAKDSLKTKELSSKSNSHSHSNTKSEIKQSMTLPQLEKQVWNGIEKGKECFLSIGEALAEIQETGLYKKSVSRTFEEYCKEKFDIKSSNVYRYIDAFKAHREIFSPIGEKTDLPLLKSESHYRELVKVKGTANQKKILAIYNRGLDPEDSITAKGLKEVISKHYDKSNKMVSKKIINQVKTINESLRTFSSEDISVEGETFEIKSKEKDVADFLKRVKEAISAGGSVQIAYKNKRKPKAMTER